MNRKIRWKKMNPTWRFLDMMRLGEPDCRLSERAVFESSHTARTFQRNTRVVVCPGGGGFVLHVWESLKNERTTHSSRIHSMNPFFNHWKHDLQFNQSIDQQIIYLSINNSAARTLRSSLNYFSMSGRFSGDVQFHMFSSELLMSNRDSDLWLKIWYA